MSVPKNERKESRFEAQHHLIKVRKEITDLVIREFGYSEVRYKQRIEKLESQFKHSQNFEEKKEELYRKMEYFKNTFIKDESRYVLELLRKVCEEFSVANSIYPSETDAKISEFITRRIHLSLAIAYCHALNHELEFIIDTLPVDLNKYKRFEDMLKKQIGLFRGVKKHDNKFMKKETDRIDDLEDRLNDIDKLLNNNLITTNQYIIDSINRFVYSYD